MQDDVAPIPGTVDANVEVLVWTDLSYIDSFHQLVQHPHVETDVLKYVATVVHAVCLIGPRDNFSFTIILSLYRNVLIDFIKGFDFLNHTYLRIGVRKKSLASKISFQSKTCQVKSIIFISKGNQMFHNGIKDPSLNISIFLTGVVICKVNQKCCNSTFVMFCM